MATVALILSAINLFYWAQAQAHMAVTGAPVCDMPVLFGGYRFEFRCFRIIRNDEFILRWFAVAESFWRDHVLADVAPLYLDKTKAAMGAA